MHVDLVLAVVTLILRHVPEPQLPRSRAAELTNPLRLFATIMREQALRPVLLLYLLVGFAESASAAAFLFLFEGTLGLERWGSTLLLLQSAAMLVSLPIWSKLGARTSRRRLLIFAFAWEVVTAPLVMVLPASALVPAIVFLFLRGVSAGVDFMLLRAMVADVARDTAATGPVLGAVVYAK